MILLDTNICIYIINKRPVEVQKRFEHYKLGEVGVSSVVAAELSFGVAKSGSARNQQELEMFQKSLTIKLLVRHIVGIRPPTLCLKRNKANLSSP